MLIRPLKKINFQVNLFLNQQWVENIIEKYYLTDIEMYILSSKKKKRMILDPIICQKNKHKKNSFKRVIFNYNIDRYKNEIDKRRVGVEQ